MGSGEVICSMTESARYSRRKTQCNRLEVQKNNIKKAVLDTTSNKIGQLDRKARKPWITQKMINKMNKGSRRV